MSLQTIARRYGAALADVAILRGEQQKVKAEIESWASMIDGNAQLKEVFANPTIPQDQKRRLLKELIAKTRVSETTAAFLQVLLKNQRLAQIKDIAERYGQILDQRSGVVAAHVTTARSVSEDQKNALREVLGKLTGANVRLEFETDETIIGGLVARIGSTVFDGSVETQLQRLTADMTNR